MASGKLFNAVYGRGLIPELPKILHRPYLVVTMADLWPLFSQQLTEGLGAVHLVNTIEERDLAATATDLPLVESVVGLGGGRAVDVAKYIAWRRRLPLFQVPTSMSVNAPFAHRAALRANGVINYRCWAVPEVVYVDFDVIRSAPTQLNWSGIGDILCYHTAHWDWQLADKAGKTERQWPYDDGLVTEARTVLENVLDALDDIHDLNDHGIRVLMEALRWGGAAFANAGWNPRHIEGSEHHFFYALEHLTKRPFLHGQPVGLGVLLMSALQDNEFMRMKTAADRVGLRYRPEDMGVTWDDVTTALHNMPAYIKKAGLWYTVACERGITDDFVLNVRNLLSE